MAGEERKLTRRDLLRTGAGVAGLAALGGGLGFLYFRRKTGDLVWQIDPDKCIQCGNCETNCVLKPSAVKCVHAFTICGYCDYCFGFFDEKFGGQTTAAEGQLCPVDAIRRKHVTGPYYEYTIDEEKCTACGRCAKGCNKYGNGSLHLQVRHDRCLNCSQCSIAEACPSEAFVRVPADEPYLTKPRGKTA